MAILGLHLSHGKQRCLQNHGVDALHDLERAEGGFGLLTLACLQLGTAKTVKGIVAQFGTLRLTHRDVVITYGPGPHLAFRGLVGQLISGGGGVFALVFVGQLAEGIVRASHITGLCLTDSLQVHGFLSVRALGELAHIVGK